MSWFSSWDDFTKKASEAAKSASSKAAEVAKAAADKSKVVAAQVNEKVNKFVEEQKKEYNEVEQDTDLAERKKRKKQQMMESGKPPWHIDANSANTEVMDELRLNILKLCEDENNFLIKAPTSTSVFDFKLEYALPYAQCALAQDPVLPKIRFKLVPRKLEEEQFWKNYFYRVNVIRESLGVKKMDFGKAPIATTPRSRSPSGSNTEKNASSNSSLPPNDGTSNANDKSKEENKENDNYKDNKSKEEVNNAQNNNANDKSKEENKENDKDNYNKSKEEPKQVSNKEEDKKSKSILESTKPEALQAQKSSSASSQPPKLEDSGIKMNLAPHDLNKVPSSEQITEMASDIDNANNDMDLNQDDEDFLSDDLHINNMTEEEKAKMKQDLGLNAEDDIENVDDILAEVNTEDVGDISDGELDKELENL
eukprot:CAMPEP_0201592404 /NCGR_PEP_ID=MMETSP0190_2-20130828/190312_1 /ASSEMBLY_ACC=CAM_ASM_000263 /TAXON_ID=37353 /ORGANISM="Rosalina sp." /LENGTH=423 /DNA_ID=CAMNT_0048051167 /DNA_START=8 /DNA_END=1280 /DNA_ORIENTATION=-